MATTNISRIYLLSLNTRVRPVSVERRVGDRDRSPAARDESPGSDRVDQTRRPPPRVARSGRSRRLAGRSVGVPCDPEVRRPCPRARRLPSRTRPMTCPTTEPEPAGTSYPTRTSTGERGRSHRRAEEARRTTVRAVTSAASNPTTASGVAVRGRRLRRSTRARDARGPARERGRRGRTDARWPKRRGRPSGAGHTTRSATCVVGVIGVASPGPRVMGGSGRESPSRTVPISSPPLPSTSRRGFRGSPLHRVPGVDSGRRPGVRERVDPETRSARRTDGTRRDSDRPSSGTSCPPRGDDADGGLYRHDVARREGPRRHPPEHPEVSLVAGLSGSGFRVRAP